MNRDNPAKRIEVEFVDASKGKEISWSIPLLVASDAAKKIRRAGERFLDVTIFRRIGSQLRQRHAFPR